MEVNNTRVLSIPGTEEEIAKKLGDLKVDRFLTRLSCPRVIFLNLTTEVILERLAYRAVDPVTGERYHMLFKSAPSKKVHERLLTNPKDVEEYVKTKVETYFRLSGDMKELFEDAVSINADQDPQTVFEYIESCIVNPLPSIPPWKPKKPTTS